METITLTPEYASDLLRGMVTKDGIGRPINPIDPQKVEQYAAAMKTGSWKRSFDPIWLTKDGYLVNGQHRCSAVIASGKTIVNEVRHLDLTLDEYYRRVDFYAE
jgi:hypothetical protein